ncbi:hypothetical protein HDV03_000993 [Kappamyces sp. JEL0829]|nr:hypothetical protein HDV03_000993 [Kappamyces sp. JEL0829]
MIDMTSINHLQTLPKKSVRFTNQETWPSFQTYSDDDYDRTALPMTQVDYKIMYEVMTLRMELRNQYAKEAQVGPPPNKFSSTDSLSTLSSLSSDSE